MQLLEELISHISRGPGKWASFNQSPARLAELLGSRKEMLAHLLLKDAALSRDEALVEKLTNLAMALPSSTNQFRALPPKEMEPALHDMEEQLLAALSADRQNKQAESAFHQSRSRIAAVSMGPQAELRHQLDLSEPGGG